MGEGEQVAGVCVQSLVEEGRGLSARAPVRHTDVLCWRSESIHKNGQALKGPHQRKGAKKMGEERRRTQGLLNSPRRHGKSHVALGGRR